MRLVMAKPTDEKGTSPFQALMVSSAACVGTGNIIGISTAICLGGPAPSLDDRHGPYWGRIIFCGVHLGADL